MEIQTIKQETKRKINTIFQIAGKLASDSRKMSNYLSIVNEVERQVGADPSFYDQTEEGKEKRARFQNALFQKMQTADQDIYAFARVEINTPFSFFFSLLESDISDILMSKNMIKVQYNSIEFDNFHVPEELRETISVFIDRVVENQKYKNETKLDPKNAILDTTFYSYRMNIVHKNLSAYGSHVITFRKHIESVADLSLEINQEAYERSLDVPPEVMQQIKDLSGKSFCIFGSTGSGKTTLLRMLTNHKLESKRNVCVIEDSKELFIETPLSWVTNKEHTIRDLFVASLRQNPSHIIIGETRTEEIVDILETGLTSSVSTTIHADSFNKAVERIYYMSLQRQIEKSDIIDLINSSIDMFIHMKDRKIHGVFVRNKEVGASVYESFDTIYLRKEE